MSEPQIPTASTSSSTSPLPATGSGSSRNVTSFGAVYTRAFIVRSSRGEAAVDEEGLPRDVIGGAARKIDERAAEVVEQAVAADHRLRRHRRGPARIVEHRRGKLGREKPGRDRIAIHA